MKILFNQPYVPKCTKILAGCLRFRAIRKIGEPNGLNSLLNEYWCLNRYFSYWNGCVYPPILASFTRSLN